MNKSKINEKRFWDRWKASGAIGNLESAFLQSKDFENETIKYTISAISFREPSTLEFNLEGSPLTHIINFDDKKNKFSKPDLSRKLKVGDKLLMEGFEENDTSHFLGIKTIKGIYFVSEDSKLPTPLYVRE